MTLKKSVRYPIQTNEISISIGLCILKIPVTLYPKFTNPAYRQAKSSPPPLVARELCPLWKKNHMMSWTSWRLLQTTKKIAYDVMDRQAISPKSCFLLYSPVFVWGFLDLLKRKTRQFSHSIQPIRQSSIMSNHDPIIPTINDLTATIPAAPDRQCPLNVPTVTQSQQYNILSSQSINQSQIS